ncbi:hypothetical protein DASC09_046550 [Saccharomycopsis crataegensis]|uniref:Uncharacterized protein n=1 Tax=Saccharomycopsis crataegensis TaxID=43959 RepID=A0AAV5QQW2_9ASCO|nr:hypothetical protein DASC09_046550 [Saccharomycopsis crataegensis]
MPNLPSSAPSILYIQCCICFLEHNTNPESFQCSCGHRAYQCPTCQQISFKTQGHIELQNLSQRSMSMRRNKK